MGTARSAIGLLLLIGGVMSACDGGGKGRGASIAAVRIYGVGAGDDTPSIKLIVAIDIDDGAQRGCRMVCQGNAGTTELVWIGASKRFEGERTGRCLRYDFELSDDRGEILDATKVTGPEWHRVSAREEGGETLITWTPAGERSYAGHLVEVFVSGHGPTQDTATSGPDDGEERLQAIGLSSVKVVRRWTDSALDNFQVEYAVTAIVD